MTAAEKEHELFFPNHGPIYFFRQHLDECAGHMAGRTFFLKFYNANFINSAGRGTDVKTLFFNGALC